MKARPSVATPEAGPFRSGCGCTESSPCWTPHPCDVPCPVGAHLGGSAGEGPGHARPTTATRALGREPGPDATLRD